MEIKDRSKSEFLQIRNLNKILHGPKHTFKKDDQTLSPIRLNAKGLKDLKKNKTSKILLETNSYYLSCPENDEESECSTKITKNSVYIMPSSSVNKLSCFKETSLNMIKSLKSEESLKKTGKKLGFQEDFHNNQVCIEEYNDLKSSINSNTNNKDFTYQSVDDSHLQLEYDNKKKGFFKEEMKIDSSCGLRQRNSIKKEKVKAESLVVSSQTSKIPKKKLKEMKVFSLEEESDENDDFELGFRKGKSNFKGRERTFSSILSKLSVGKREECESEN